MKKMNEPIIQMLEKAKTVMMNAYAPYSHFLVGSCIRTSLNQFYVGCNYENASYALTQCAEASAIGSMISAGEKQIAEIVIIGSSQQPCVPCGACRQRIREFAEPDILIHLYGDGGRTHMTKTLGELLPFSFGPNFLSNK